MTYYRVLPQYGNAQITKFQRGKIVIDRWLIARELYTPGEIKKLLRGATVRGNGVKPETIVFEKIEIPKNQVYWCFGARFASEGVSV